MTLNTIYILITPKSTSISYPVIYASPTKSSTWISTKHLEYCMMLNFSSKPASPLDFLISENDSNFLLVAQKKKNLFPIFPYSWLISKHTVNPRATVYLYHHLPSPTATSLSSPPMPQPHWLSFHSSTINFLLFTLIISDHSHPFANSLLCLDCLPP